MKATAQPPPGRAAGMGIIVEELDKNKLPRNLDDTRMGYVGWFFKTTTLSWDFQKIRKQFKRIDRWYVRDFRRNLSAMEAQLDQKRVTPVILSRLLFHFRNLERIDIHYRGLSHDYIMLIKFARDDFDIFTKEVATFVAIFKNVYAVKRSKVAGYLQDLIAADRKLYNIVNSDVLKQRDLNKVVKEISSHCDALLEGMKAHSNSLRAKIQHDPINQMRKMAK